MTASIIPYYPTTAYGRGLTSMKRKQECLYYIEYGELLLGPYKQVRRAELWLEKQGFAKVGDHYENRYFSFVKSQLDNNFSKQIKP